MNDHEAEAFERYLRNPGPGPLGEVVKLFYEPVWRVALRLTRNKEDAVDLCQDVFLGLLLSPPAPGSVRSARGYLAFRALTLAARRARSSHRRKKREAAFAERITSRNLDDDDLDSLRAAMEELPPRIRTAIELHYLGGYTCRAIAQLSHVAERTVAIDLKKGRELLRKRLGQTILGTLALLKATEWAPAQPPAHLIENLTRIANAGSALRPLVAHCFVGGLILKKLLVATGCVVLALLSGGWVFQQLRSGQATQDPGRLSLNQEGRPGISPASLAQPQKDISSVVRETRSGPTVSLRVVDEAGHPIPEATASLSSGERVKMTLNGEQARLELPSAAAGVSKIVLSAAGYFPESIETTNSSSDERREVVLMSIHELTVRTVRDSARTAAPGCEVYVHRNLPDEHFIIGGKPSEILQTSADGTATVADLRSSDKLHLFAVNEAGGILSAVEEVKLPFDEVTLSLKPMRFVRGRVLSEEGRPISGADVWLHEAGESWSPDWRKLRGLEIGRKPLEMDRSDEEGSFLVRWPASRRPLVAARAEGFVVALRELQPAELDQSIEIVLKRGALIEGIVLDEKGLPATADATFAVGADDSQNADSITPWRVYFHPELKVPFRFILKDVEYESARYLIVDHRGKYGRQTVRLTDDERQGKQQVQVILEPDPSKQVLIELAVILLDKVTGWQPQDPHPHVQVTRLPAEAAIPVEGNNSYGGFGWWSAVEPGEYRIDVVTRGFFNVTRIALVQEGSRRPSESHCCSEQFRVEIPLERNPALKDELNLPELLQVVLLDERDRKPPPERSSIIWQVLQLPDRTPVVQKVCSQLEYRNGTAIRREVLKAGSYEVQIDCEGFRPTSREVVLPQESPTIDVLLAPEWRSPDEARAAIPELVRKLRFDVDERNRAQAALIRIGTDAVPAVTGLLDDDDLEVRCGALRVLGGIRPPSREALERILTFLESPAAQIRACAARALGDLGKVGAPAIPALVALLDDPDGQVRAGAATALGTMGPMALELAAKHLQILLDDEYEWARFAAKLALQKMKTSEQPFESAQRARE